MSLSAPARRDYGRQQQQPALEVDGLDLVAPELVGQRHHREAEVLLAQAQVAQQLLGGGLQVLLFLRPAALSPFADQVSGSASPAAVVGPVAVSYPVAVAVAVDAVAADCHLQVLDQLSVGACS